MNRAAIGEIIFASDFHLGSPGSKEGEILRWLDGIPAHSEVFLLGDTFDFWVEFKNFVPTHYLSFFTTVQKMLSRGIKISMFKGNHDMWIGEFARKQGISVIDDSLMIKRQGINIYMHHGDGILEGEFTYKCLKKVLRHPVSQHFLKMLPPDILFSCASRLSHAGHNKKNLHESQNVPYIKLIEFARALNKRHSGEIHEIILGHYHQVTQRQVSSGLQLSILGDWIHAPSYGRLEAGKIKIYHL